MRNDFCIKHQSFTCVNTSTGTFGCIPPIYCKYFNRIKEQLVIHWDTTLRRLRTQLIQFISNNIKDTQEKEVLTRYTYQFLPQYTAWSFCILYISIPLSDVFHLYFCAFVSSFRVFRQDRRQSWCGWWMKPCSYCALYRWRTRILKSWWPMSPTLER